VLTGDPAQQALAIKLDQLIGAIGNQRASSPANGIFQLFRKTPARPAPKGLYIHGAVGRGKSMLMDLFHETLQEPRKRRVHFHAFMAEIHDRLHALRQREAGRGEPIQAVAHDIAAQTRVLCFDEFSVTNIADAMILARLFSALWDAGLVVVATSNVAPADLYKDGLSRDRFLPFIALLQDHMEILSLDARTDYRLAKLAKGGTFFTPLGPQSDAAIDALWRSLGAGAAEASRRIKVHSREVIIERALPKAARFSFDALFGKPFGAIDYQALAESFAVIVIENVPVMAASQRNELKRFITAVDVFYEAKTMIILSAAAPLNKLAENAEGTEAFEFQRTQSRLIEMQSSDYLQTWQAQPKASLTIGNDD
jgi:cell division protein ZapE